MEESNKHPLDEQDAGASGDAMAIHKVASSRSQVDSKEGSAKGKGTSLTLDIKEVNEKLFSQCSSSVNSAEISTQEPDKPETRSKGGCAPIVEKGFVKSPDAAPPSVAINTIELKSYGQKFDGIEPSRSHQQDLATRKERSLEVKVDHQMAQEWTDRTNEAKEVDISNDMTPIDSSSGDEPTEETLVNDVKDTVFSTDEREETLLSKEKTGLELVPEMEVIRTEEVEREFFEPEQNAQPEVGVKTPSKTFLLDANAVVENETGTEEEQAAFMKELEAFHRERCLEFKPPRFYGEPLNCLKLWRAVIKLGGYEQVTSCKLWRQVGESFNPPKTCTTVSWTFRGFYEKALLEYEKHKMRSGELPFSDASFSEPSSTGNQTGLSQASGSGRARRDAAARAMQGWHSQRLLGNGEVGDPIIKDKSSVSLPKREKQLKSVGLLKRKRLSPVDHTLQVARLKASKPQVETMVADIGAPADWVKINVQRTKDCFEVYALVPGLLREEVRVQSDPAGRLVISGQPEQLDNPWGVTPFKKVVSLPSRIDPHQTSAVVTLHGQLFVRVPFEQADM